MMKRPLSIVTGASRGMGRAIAEQLLAAGHDLLCIARRANPELDAAARAAGVHCVQWEIDLGASPQAAAERLAQWLAARDPAAAASVTLINNAAAVTRPGRICDTPLDELTSALRVGLEACVLLSAAFLRATRDWSCPRRLLNISSGLGRRALAGSASYCAVKAGMDNFSRAVALDEAEQPNGARVVSLAPGVIDTDMQRQLRAADAVAFPNRELFQRLHDEGQLLSPAAAAARVIAYLERPEFGAQVLGDVRELDASQDKPGANAQNGAIVSKPPEPTMERAHASPAPTPAASGAAAGFEVLDKVHQQTFEMLDQFTRMVEQVDSDGIQDASRATAAAIDKFFSTVAHQHHEDEERHVFPALAASKDPDIVQATLRLQQDHHWLEEDWLELAPQVRAIAAGFNWYDIAVLREGVAIFSALYRDHIELEEHYIYPEARARMKPADFKGMGREMAERRAAVRRAGKR